MKIYPHQITDVPTALKRIYGDYMPRGPVSEETRAKMKAAWAARKEAKVAPIAEQIGVVMERKADTVIVTYRPFDGDPHSTVWHGVKFQANIPVELDRNNRAHHIEQLLPRSFAGTNGETLTKHVPAMMFMGDLARGNPSFEVDGERAKKLINKRILPQAGHGWAEDHADEIVEFR